MTRHAFPLAGLAALLAAVPIALAAMPAATDWEIGPRVDGRNYSIGMPDRPRAGPNGALIVDLPRAGAGQVDALTTGVAPLADARRITMRYRIDAAPGTRFVADETPDQPATVSLYFQRRGDNWRGRGRFASYRWYAPAAGVVPLAPGERTVVLRLDDEWTNVQGQSSRDLPQDYAAALAETARIGIAFGSSARRSHGVAATGPARFTLLALTID